MSDPTPKTDPVDAQPDGAALQSLTDSTMIGPGPDDVIEIKPDPEIDSSQTE